MCIKKVRVECGRDCIKILMSIIFTIIPNFIKDNDLKN